MKTKKPTLKVIFLSLLVVFAVSSPAVAADPLLDMLPADTLICVRINNLDMALSQLDAYLTGTSPLPLGMLAKGQLGQIVGDPMLTGINTGGNFCFVLLSQADTDEPIGGLMVPMTSFDDFVAKNPNCTKDEAGAIILESPNSPVGNLALSKLAGGKYALVLPQTFGTIDQLKVQITATGKSLQSRLSAEQAKEAVTAPAWAFVNAASLYEKYSQDVLDTLESTQEELSGAAMNPEVAAQMGPMAEMLEMYFKMYAELFKTFGADADSVTLALTPDAGNLSIDLSLKAKKGSETAAMFAANPEAKAGYTMTGYLDNTNAINGVMKMDDASMQKMYDKLFDIMGQTSDGKIKAETLEKMKSLTRKSLAAMGNEAAFSFSYAGATPPLKLVEVVTVDDMKAAQALMKDGMSLVNDLYAGMGLPMTFQYSPATGKYKNATIDSMTLSMTKSDDPASPMAAAMEKMYGEGFVYKVAHTTDKYYIAMGADADEQLKKIIDQDAAATATGEVKVAIDMLSNAGYGDFACSINIIKLIAGLGEMVSSIEGLNQNGGNPMPKELFAIAKNIPSQSSLALGGKSSDGQASLRVVLPKQHLMELMMMAMQMQQKMMMQMQPQPQGGMMGQ